MTGSGRRHDRALLDALEAMQADAFAGPTWRVTAEGRDPLRPSTSGGRWSAPGAFEVLYTSLSAAGAMAEIGYRLSLEPVWPSRARHELHRIAARADRMLRFADVGDLKPLGVDASRFGGFDYAVTQAIAAAAYFLEFDGLVVPSARASELNLVLFTERPNVDIALTVEETAPVDWDAWLTRQSRARRGSSG